MKRRSGGFERGEDREDGARDNAGAMGKRVFFRRRKMCPLADIPNEDINYKNLKLISRFISERGRILPSRITSVSAIKQRRLASAIKRARNLALLPFVAQ